MKRLLRRILTLLALTASFSTAQAADQIADTTRVWQHHIDAWNARDVEAIVSDYTDASVVVMLDRVYEGKDEIRGLFQKLFATFDRADEHRIDPALIKGRIVYITWRAKIDGVSVPLGTDTFVIDGGKILYQTITSNPPLF